MPTLTLVAGPNGSGKSTLTAAIASEGLIVVDPDAIARTIDPGQPNRAAIAVARQAVLRCRSLLAHRESFILESTLAGHGALSLMREAKRVSGVADSLLCLAILNFLSSAYCRRLVPGGPCGVGELYCTGIVD